MVFSLPEGLIKTSPEIYAALANHAVMISPEEMIQFSNAYSILNQKFDDAASARAKNFWRRVEGRQLSGPAVAKLFKEFVSGQTFDTAMRARGQDGEPMPSQETPEVDGKPPIESTQGIDSQPHEQPEEGGGSLDSSPPAPTPSSSRSGPPRSILKKVTSPSALEAQFAEPTPPKAKARPTEAMLAEAQRAAEWAAQIAADLEAELTSQPPKPSATVPLQTQVIIGFCIPGRSSNTTKKSSLPTPPPKRKPSAPRQHPANPEAKRPGEQNPPPAGDFPPERRVSFMDTPPRTTPPQRQSTVDSDDTLVPDASSSSTRTERTMPIPIPNPMDRFSPRIGYIPQRVERSALLLTGRVMDGSART